MNENRVAEYLQSCEEKLRISNEKCECFQKELEVQINTNQALNKAFDQSKKKSEECKAKLTSKNQLLKKSKDEISNAEIRQNSLRKKIINLEEKYYHSLIWVLRKSVSNGRRKIIKVRIKMFMPCE